MSQWTHVRGCLELSGTATAKKLNSKTGEYTYYLPYPEQQLKISAPRPRLALNSTDSGIDYHLQIYCLPRCQEIIDNAMKLLPSGEYNKINYNIFQPKNRFRSSSSQAEPWEKKIFKERILKQYQEDEGYDFTWAAIKKYYNINIDYVDYATDFTLTISDDIRDCSGIQLLVSLEKVFKFLHDAEIDITEGILDWSDEWKIEKFQCIVTSAGVIFKIYDQNTGATIAYKIYKEKWNKSLDTFEVVVDQSDNWYEFVPKAAYEEESNN